MTGWTVTRFSVINQMARVHVWVAPHEACRTQPLQCGDFTGMPKPGGNPLLRKKPKVVSFPLPSGLQTTFQRPPRGGPPEVSRCPETVREGENECSEADKGHICWKVGRVASQEQFGSDLGQILTSEGSQKRVKVRESELF